MAMNELADLPLRVTDESIVVHCWRVTRWFIHLRAVPRLHEASARYLTRLSRRYFHDGLTRTGKIILQRPIEAEQVQKLLTTGKTDLLHRFISKKGRPFSAFLTRGENGKVSFEFAPREPKVVRPKGAARARKAAAG